MFYSIHSFIVYLTELIFRSGSFFCCCFFISVCHSFLVRYGARHALSFLQYRNCVRAHRVWLLAEASDCICANMSANDCVLTITRILLSLHSSFGTIVKFSRNKFYVQRLANAMMFRRNELFKIVIVVVVIDVVVVKINTVVTVHSITLLHPHRNFLNSF